MDALLLPVSPTEAPTIDNVSRVNGREMRLPSLPMRGVINLVGLPSVAVPIGFGKRDVGLMLVADLQAGRHGAVERVVLQCVAQKVGPS